jgi:surface protein
MKPTIIAKDKSHLKALIANELKKNGERCDLNHIDVSNVTDLSYIFNCLDFHGDISKWDVSNVENMNSLFYFCEFNGDISNWNTSKVTDMGSLFIGSKFNGDISNWTISKVTNMDSMFEQSQFNHDLTEWKPSYSLEGVDNMFHNCPAPIPYWAQFEEKDKRNKAIDSYWLKKELTQELSENSNLEKKIKL